VLLSVDASLFQKVVFQVSVEAKRTVKIIGRHRQAADHPINICHPESDYLKSLLLYVE
jgi:23S rRNA (cytosine1962-C5)-methyltransferase